MKLALVSHHIFREDGQSRVNFEIARHALSHGLQVVLVADKIDPILLEWGAEWVKAQPPPLYQKTHVSKVYDFARRADRALFALEVPPDIIHANGFTLTVPHQVNTDFDSPLRGIEDL